MSAGEDVGVNVGENIGTSGRRIFVPEQGGIIFQENWAAIPEMDIAGDYKNHSWAPITMPSTFDFQNTSQLNPTNPAGLIKAGSGIGGTKSLQVWDESYGDASRWGHDLQLMKHFGYTYYSDIWFKFSIRFNPLADRTNAGNAKIFRGGAYNPRFTDGTLVTDIFNTPNTSLDNGGLGPTTNGLFFYDVARVTSTHFRHHIAMRSGGGTTGGTQNGYKPLINSLLNPDFEFRNADGTEYADKTWEGTFGDGQWHTYEFRMIKNSVPGQTVGDGVLECYLDGAFQFRVDYMPWIGLDADWTPPGFNCFSLGGNANWLWAGDVLVNPPEQHFYDIDDVVVSTSRIV